MTELSTDRLVLRQWHEPDRAPFAELNADPEIMEHFPSKLTQVESDALADVIEGAIERRGFGFWAMERVSDGTFLGFTGISQPKFDASFTPCTEIGWRLRREAWGHGYATEGARASLAFAFDELGLDEVVAFTATTNARSEAVMRRLGMTHDAADDFDHPALPAGHHLQRHVLFRIRRPHLE